DRSDQVLERAEQPVALGLPHGPRLGAVRRDDASRRARRARRRARGHAGAGRDVADRPELPPADGRARRARRGGRRRGARLPARLEPLAARPVARQGRRDRGGDVEAGVGHGGRRLDVRGRRGAGLRAPAHHRAAPRPGAARLLVQPARPAAGVGRDDAAQGERGELVLPALLHGAGASGRHPQACGRRLRPGVGHLPVVPLRGPALRDRRGVAPSARRHEAAHRDQLGRLAAARRARLVRPPDGGARGVRHDDHALLHAERARTAPRPHEPPARRAGVRRLRRDRGPSLRAGRPYGGRDVRLPGGIGRARRARARRAARRCAPGRRGRARGRRGGRAV
ncbi:MAG: GH39, partial [uncultured Thermomicrobiales bacterium]